MEKGTQTETAAERHRSARRPAAPAKAIAKVERLVEGLPDVVRDRLVMACVGPARSVKPSSAVDPRGVDVVHGRLVQILALRATVELAERVEMVDVGRHRGRALGESARRRFPESPTATMRG